MLRGVLAVVRVVSGFEAPFQTGCGAAVNQVLMHATPWISMGVCFVCFYQDSLGFYEGIVLT
jgi:hypothetical protein